MTKINMAGWSQDQIANWQDPMLSGMQQGPKKLGLDGKPVPFQQLEGKPWGGMIPSMLSGINGIPKNPNPVYNDIIPFNANDNFGGGTGQAVPQILPTPNPVNPNDNLENMPGTIVEENNPATGIGNLTGLPNYDDKFAGYDTKIGGFDNQFKDILSRLVKLEQGIGGIATQPKSSPLDGGVFSIYQGNNSRGY